MTRKALVVLSGGQDSTTCLFLAKRDFEEVSAITFDYNQRHSRELDAAVKVAQLAGVTSHEIVRVPDILAGKSFLTDKSARIETFTDFESMSHHNAFKEDKLDSSFVPMRNSLFLTLAANRASVLGCGTIVTGVTAADFAEYGEFSWPWVGGFVDAEGMFDRVNTNSWRLIISQKDPELLHRLRAWLQGEASKLGSEFTASISLDKRDCAELYIGVRSAEPLMSLLSPHLHSPHRRTQAEKRGVSLLAEAPLSDAYVAGFWEGDGGCYSHFSPVRNARGEKTDKITASFEFGFYQKDPEVLEKIQEYLKKGSLYQAKNQNHIWSLRVSDGPLSQKLLRRLKPHLCVLGSFEKITKWRHRVDMLAGGFNPPYPDCTPDFVWLQQSTINEALKTPFADPVEIQTPLMFLTKAESVRLAKGMIGCWEALAYSHTAYSGEYPPLTQDHATVLRAKGFLDAGLPDPLITRAYREGLMELPQTSNYDSVRS